MGIRRILSRSVVVVGLTLPLLLAAAVAAAPAAARQLTVNITADEAPQVSRDRIVWMGTGGSDGGPDFEIFTWTPAGGVKQLTANNTLDFLPQVSGDRVVWYGQGGLDGGTDFEVFTWTPATGLLQLTQNATEDIAPEVSGDRIAWYGTGGSDGGTDFEIFTWTPVSGTKQLTANATLDALPQVSGDRIVWIGTGGSDGGADTEVFTWTAGGVQQLTADTTSEEGPQVSGDRVVWYGAGGSDGGADFEIFTWTPGGVQQLTANTTADLVPQVSGDRIAWFGAGGSDGGTDFEVFTWIPATGLKQITANNAVDELPAVSGDRVVWQGTGGSDGGTDFEVFAWTPDGGIQQITTNSTQDQTPQVSDDRTAWQGTGGFDGGTDLEIFSVVASNVVSVEGPTRIGTAIAASKAAFTKADTVVIATGFNFPDALGGSSLAGALGAPLLLTNTDLLPQAVADEIKRLGATDAVILGREPAVGPGVAAQLTTLLGSGHVRRIGGVDRYETAALVAAETVATLTAKGKTFDGTVFVAVGTNFPDALAASPLAAAKGWPILLTRTGGLPGSSVNALSAIAAKRAVMLGSESVVSAAVAGQLAGKVGSANVSRLAGPNRYLTAIEVAKFGKTNGIGFTNFAIATGENYPDALSGGVMAGRFSSVLLLTPKDSLQPDVAALITANKADVERVHFLGSTAAISQTVRDAVAALLK